MVYSLGKMHSLAAISVFLVLAGSSAVDQTQKGVASTSELQLSVGVSPLDGNWNIAGNRQKGQYPLLSMHLQVSGTQIVGRGDVQVKCPEGAELVSGAIGGGLSGEINSDGDFTLRNNNTVHTIQIEIHGRVPTAGAITWSGEYILTRAASPNCVPIHYSDSFTAEPLAPLNGTFSGRLDMRYYDVPPPSYRGPITSQAKFSITVTQGPVVSQRLNEGGNHFYLPITGTILVHGSSCFSRGFANPSVNSTHGLPPSPYSSVQGDFVDLKFAMDDESQLNVQAVFAGPDESALLVFDARVVGGKCDKQSFRGTLSATVQPAKADVPSP